MDGASGLSPSIENRDQIPVLGVVSPRWSNLSILPVTEDRVFVVDRTNGRWVFLPSSATPLLQLLNTPSGDLPEEVAAHRDNLAGELWTQGLGGRPYSTPGDLNTIILKLTKACNYACTYCYDMESDDSIEHLPLDMALQVIEEGLDLTPRKLGIILHGGEPTLLFEKLIKPLAIESLAMAEEKAKEIVFLGQTNLSRLTSEMVDFFVEHKLHWGISLDGPPEINDRFRIKRNGEGTYHFFSEALERYPDFVRSCGIMSVITARNDRHLLPIARHFRDLGMPSWDWSLFFPIGQGRIESQVFQFSTERMLDSWAELFEAVEAGEFDGMTIRPVTAYLENFFRGPGNNMCLKKDCGAARDLLSVSSNGTIQACDCIDPKGPHADLGLVQIGGAGSLSRARSSEVAATLRSRDVTRGHCRDCAWLALCGGTCGAHAHELHGTWDAQCRLAMLAYGSIVSSLAQGDGLRRYWKSLRPGHDSGVGDA